MTDDAARDGLLAEGEEPVVRLRRWTGPWPDDDPDANFKADVATYAHADPLATLTNLARNLDVPVGALVRYVLARWASGGSEALLELGPSTVARMAELVDRAEEAGTDADRLEAYDVLRQMVSWLAAGYGGQETAYPSGGAGPRRHTRIAAYGVITTGDRILLCRVAAGFPGEGRWTLPGGGVEFGEDPEAAVLREIHEETGLHAALRGLLEVNARHIPAAENFSSDHLHWIRMLYEADVPTDVEPHVVDVDGSTDDVRWFTAAETARIELLELAQLGVKLAGLSGSG